MNPTPEQQAWLNEQMSKTPVEPNPCVRLFGPGPDGETCRHCAHLLRKRMSKTYLKCALRQNTSGPATDHKAKWNACTRFEKTCHP